MVAFSHSRETGRLFDPSDNGTDSNEIHSQARKASEHGRPTVAVYKTVRFEVLFKSDVERTGLVMTRVSFGAVAETTTTLVDTSCRYNDTDPTTTTYILKKR